MSRQRKRRSLVVFIALLVTIALIAVGCGGSGETEAQGVASLEGSDEGSPDGADQASELSADEATLEFSQCMRDEGLDFPDLALDENGNPDIRDAFASAGIEPGGEDFRGAMETCVALIEGVGFGGRGRRGLVDDTELQDAFVEFSDCIRDEGFDVGDLEFDGPRGRPGPGGEDGAPGGFGEDGPPEFGEDGPDREGGFGDRSGFIAESLGLDPDDPDVVAALELCGPVLEEATAGFRPGGPGADQD